MRCPACGAEQSGGVYVCRNCGSFLRARDTSAGPGAGASTADTQTAEVAAVSAPASPAASALGSSPDPAAIYSACLKAEREERWQDAFELFLQLEQLDATHVDAAVRLASYRQVGYTPRSPEPAVAGAPERPAAVPADEPAPGAPTEVAAVETSSVDTFAAATGSPIESEPGVAVARPAHEAGLFDLVFENGPQAGAAIRLGAEPATIGRRADNMIVLSDREVSRHHARVEIRGGVVVLTDVGSTNGTFVNGLRIEGPQVLRSGDFVELGSSCAVLRLNPSAPAAASEDTVVSGGVVSSDPPTDSVTRRSLSDWLRTTAALRPGETTTVTGEASAAAPSPVPDATTIWRGATAPQSAPTVETGSFRVVAPEQIRTPTEELLPPVTVWGSEGGGGGQFRSPLAVAIDSTGDVYVTDSKNHRIQKFDPTGRFIATWGGFGLSYGQFRGPTGIAVDAQGNIYVADSGNNRIQKLDSTGRPIHAWGRLGEGQGEFRYPESVAVDAAGFVYVVDTENERVQKFDGDGQFVAQWSGRDGAMAFREPVGIAAGGDGTIYLTNAGARPILAFDSAGRLLGELSSNRHFGDPHGVAVDRDGNVYVADALRQCIQKLDSAGRPVLRWGGHGADPGRFNRPEGVAVDRDGYVYVADADNSRIQKFKP